MSKKQILKKLGWGLIGFGLVGAVAGSVVGSGLLQKVQTISHVNKTCFVQKTQTRKKAKIEHENLVSVLPTYNLSCAISGNADINLTGLKVPFLMQGTTFLAPLTASSASYFAEHASINTWLALLTYLLTLTTNNSQTTNSSASLTSQPSSLIQSYTTLGLPLFNSANSGLQALYNKNYSQLQSCITDFGAVMVGNADQNNASVLNEIITPDNVQFTFTIQPNASTSTTFLVNLATLFKTFFNVPQLTLSPKQAVTCQCVLQNFAILLSQDAWTNLSSVLTNSTNQYLQFNINAPTPAQVQWWESNGVYAFSSSYIQTHASFVNNYLADLFFNSASFSTKAETMLGTNEDSFFTPTNSGQYSDNLNQNNALTFGISQFGFENALPVTVEYPNGYYITPSQTVLFNNSKNLLANFYNVNTFNLPNEIIFNNITQTIATTYDNVLNIQNIPHTTLNQLTVNQLTTQALNLLVPVYNSLFQSFESINNLTVTAVSPNGYAPESFMSKMHNNYNIVNYSGLTLTIAVKNPLNTPFFALHMMSSAYGLTNTQTSQIAYYASSALLNQENLEQWSINTLKESQVNNAVQLANSAVLNLPFNYGLVTNLNVNLLPNVINLDQSASNYYYDKTAQQLLALSGNGWNTFFQSWFSTNNLQGEFNALYLTLNEVTSKAVMHDNKLCLAFNFTNFGSVGTESVNGVQITSGDQNTVYIPLTGYLHTLNYFYFYILFAIPVVLILLIIILRVKSDKNFKSGKTQQKMQAKIKQWLTKEQIASKKEQVKQDAKWEAKVTKQTKKTQRLTLKEQKQLKTETKEQTKPEQINTKEEVKPEQIITKQETLPTQAITQPVKQIEKKHYSAVHPPKKHWWQRTKL